jgi:hypothetical protein
MAQDNELISIRDAAAKWHYSVYTFKYWVKHGQLTAYGSPGKIMLKIREVEHFLETRGKRDSAPTTTQDATSSASPATTVVRPATKPELKKDNPFALGEAIGKIFKS